MPACLIIVRFAAGADFTGVILRRIWNDVDCRRNEMALSKTAGKHSSGARPRNHGGSRGPSGLFRRIAPVALIAATIAAYQGSFAGVFLFDDVRHILQNERITAILPLTRFLASPRPITELSLAVNYAAGEFDPWGYHLVNLILHLLAGLLLFGLVRRSVGLAGAKPTGGVVNGAPPSRAAYVAFAAALLWMLHPLNTQAITYVVQRAESLMGMFYLAMLYALARSAGSARPAAWHALAVVCCALGMGAKPVMVTAPIAALLYDRAFLGGTWRAVARRRWALHLALVATWSVPLLTGVVRGVLDTSQSADATVGFGVAGVSAMQYAATQCGVVLHYLRLAVWPHPLCLDYDWPLLDSFAGAAPAVVGVIGLIALAIAAWVRKPAIGFAPLAFFLLLAPTSSFIPIKDPAFEHRMYLPLAAVVVMVTLGTWDLFDRLRYQGAARVLAPAVLLAVVALSEGFTTGRRNADYHDALAMWRSVADARPTNARAHNNVGIELERRGRFDEAMAAYRRAIEIAPDLAEAHYNLAIGLRREGRLDEAIAHFGEAVQYDPFSAENHLMLGNALSDAERLSEAADAFLGAIAAAEAGVAASSSDHNARSMLAKAHFNLANTFARMGNNLEAIAEYRRAIEADPKHAGAYFGLGRSLERIGRATEAIEPLRRCLELTPDYGPAQRALDRLSSLQAPGG